MIDTTVERMRARLRFAACVACAALIGGAMFSQVILTMFKPLFMALGY